jgi:hypothetical protein
MSEYQDWSSEQIQTEIDRLKKLSKDHKNEEQGMRD